MTSSAHYLLHSRVAVSAGHTDLVSTRLLSRDREGDRGHTTFIDLGADEVLELTAFSNLGELAEVMAERSEMERAVTPWLAGEWRHEILGHIEDVVDGPGAITQAPMIEMRHIEVPPPVYPDYRIWRERTIYQAVRNRSEIDTFRAYQSVLSNTPGVMFVVGFSVDPAQYWNVYRTPEYRAILVEAGNRFIVQGPAGLDCKTYARPHIAAALRERAA